MTVQKIGKISIEFLRPKKVDKLMHICKLQFSRRCVTSFFNLHRFSLINYSDKSIGNRKVPEIFWPSTCRSFMEPVGNQVNDPALGQCF